MRDFQDNKKIVLDFYKNLDQSKNNEITQVIQQYTSNDYYFRGMHPFYEQKGAVAVADIFWKPFRQSFTSIQRRQDIFMAGANEIDKEETQWVCSMGHLMGLFDKDWLGIPSTGKMAFLRYAEFNKIENYKIAETVLFCDIISIMQQVGLNPFPEQTGVAILTPGPKTHDGLLFDKQDFIESQKTLALINRMIKDINNGYEGLYSPQEELLRSWHKDMLWFGPAGIGATYTTKRYELQHQRPFRKGFNRSYNGHICRFAEGNYGGFFGWSNLSLQSLGGFMGMISSNKKSEMRVVDIYRRDGDKLAENWIFIDLLHFYYKLDLDVLTRMRSIHRR